MGMAGSNQNRGGYKPIGQPQTQPTQGKGPVGPTQPQPQPQTQPMQGKGPVDQSTLPVGLQSKGPVIQPQMPVSGGAKGPLTGVTPDAIPQGKGPVGQTPMPVSGGGKGPAAQDMYKQKMQGARKAGYNPYNPQPLVIPKLMPVPGRPIVDPAAPGSQPQGLAQLQQMLAGTQ